MQQRQPAPLRPKLPDPLAADAVLLFTRCTAFLAMSYRAPQVELQRRNSACWRSFLGNFSSGAFSGVVTGRSGASGSAIRRSAACREAYKRKRACLYCQRAAGLLLL